MLGVCNDRHLVACVLLGCVLCYSGGVITLALPCSCGNYGDVGGGLSGAEMFGAVVGEEKYRKILLKGLNKKNSRSSAHV